MVSCRAFGIEEGFFVWERGSFAVKEVGLEGTDGEGNLPARVDGHGGDKGFVALGLIANCRENAQRKIERGERQYFPLA